MYCIASKFAISANFSGRYYTIYHSIDKSASAPKFYIWALFTTIRDSKIVSCSYKFLLLDHTMLVLGYILIISPKFLL